ncbi:MAG: hypothetical protein EBZ24_14645 [Synechococcaceae bacterium WB9_4xB_025]|nr:hypothetical protein [Synechococcaceae bacterium WB9_4xB_025]
MTDQHPITPPPELVQQWHDEAKKDPCGPINWIAVKAAQWGADQELEACCEWLDGVGDLKQQLRADRRPKPPSLKEQALAELAEWENVMDIAIDSPIRRALEALPND